jgi:large subunit ribosomal protein L10
MLTKAKKEEIVSNLSKGIGEANSIVLVNFHGLTVADEYALRKNLREQGITYKVARKSLIKRALDGKASGELPELPGEVAVVYGQDVIAPAREVYNFEKDHKGVIQILGGIFEGKFQNSAYMTELATIPSREVLLSKIAFLLKSPMQRLAIAVNEVAKTK